MSLAKCKSVAVGKLSAHTLADIAKRTLNAWLLAQAHIQTRSAAVERGPRVQGSHRAD